MRLFRSVAKDGEAKKQRSAACQGWHENVPEGEYLEAKKAAQMMGSRCKAMDGVRGVPGWRES